MLSYPKDYDVVVIGGGISGTMAAIAAAREGCSTILIERYSALGGMATNALVQPITTWGIKDKYVLGGTGKKILEDMTKRDSLAATPMSTYGPTCDSEYLKKELEDKALESGVELLYGAWVRDVILKKGGKLDYIIALTKEEDFTIKGKVFIDASGDGDISEFCGVPHESAAGKQGQQGMTLMMIISGINEALCPPREEIGRIWRGHAVTKRQVCYFPHPRKGSAYFNMTEISGLDGLKADDLTKAVIECRKQAWAILEVFKKYVPGYENAYIEQTASTMGVRETRRIIGKYVLTGEDLRLSNDFEDTIARASCPVDIHFRNNGDMEYYVLKKSYGIPYRCLVTNEIPNLIVTGRCISADQVANSSLRRMAPGFALGEAAGIAASMAINTGDAGSIDIKQLQNKLKGYGAVLEPEEM